jgi:UDP-GlcNAc:undecaprenyl-phosphate/decaprenyl-phosphate GlcNAc-1-phosphate transferase
MSYWSLTSCGLLGLGIVYLTIPLILRVASAGNLSQRQRDLHHTHQQAVPRLGGLALVAAFVGVELLIAVLWPEQRAKVPGRPVVLASSLAMFTLGFWDDLKPLGARRKLVGQILIALAVCACGIGITRLQIPFSGTVVALGGWGVLLTVLWLVGMANLINLIDGVDGLAAGISLMLMALLIYVGHNSGSFALLVAGMAGALLGFLRFNFPPARIYLGDGGAYFLGFLIGMFALLSSQKGTILAALVAPLFVLALPIVDTVLAVLRRGLRGLPIFRPDRNHIHHHLRGMGMSRRKTVLSIYGVSLVFLAMGFAAYWSRGNLVPVLLGAGALILLVCAGKLRFSRNWFAVGHVVGSSLQMRQEIQYALALTRWLALEGNRCRSAEELWLDLVFAAQRLGYSSIKLALADGQRAWERPNACEPSRSVTEVLQAGRLGILELRAPACTLRTDPNQKSPECEEPFCPCVSDGKVFEIVSELLAEAWVKAAGALRKGDRTLLAFSAKRSQPKNGGCRRSPGCMAPEPLLEPTQSSIPGPEETAR